jgi:hypothetical protein
VSGSLQIPAPGVLANDAGLGASSRVHVVRAPSHGDLVLAADGALVYRVRPGFVGVDNFTYIVIVAGRPSNIATVNLVVRAPTATPPPRTTGVRTQPVTPSRQPNPGPILRDPAADPFTLPGDGGELVAVDIGGSSVLSGTMEWVVPSVALTVPGLLLVVIIVAQTLGALAWLPAVRRSLGGFGINRRARDANRDSPPLAARKR